MTVDVYTFCHNEMSILPFVVDYWKRFASRVVVYDNYSTDGSREFLEKQDIVELRSYDTSGQLDDIKLKQLKNEIWKESRGRADFVNVCDLDECLYFSSSECLAAFKRDGVAVVTPKMCNLIDMWLPKHDGQLIHTKVHGYYIERWDGIDRPELGGQLKQKACLFDPMLVHETNYKIGCYRSDFRCSGKQICTELVKCLHLHDIGLDRKLKRYAERAARMSKANIDLHLSDFYLESRQTTMRDFIRDLSESQRIDF